MMKHCQRTELIVRLITSNLCLKDSQSTFLMLVELKEPMCISHGSICGVQLYGCKMKEKSISD